MRSLAISICVVLALTLAGHGQTWTRQNSGTTQDLYGVAFRDSQNGWAVGLNGTIIHTTDGGETWTTEDFGVTTDRLAITFVNDQEGWIVGETGILHTTDGWETWSIGPFGEAWDIAFGDPDHGWTVGGGVMHTANGGATWTTQSVPAEGALFGVAALDTSRAWVMGEGGTIWRTVDGGATWTGQEIATSGVWCSMVFASQSEGWIAGLPGRVMHTTDSGETWAMQNSGPLSHWMYSVAAVDTENVWVVGEYGDIRHSTNGGANWNRETVGDNDLRGVCFVDANHGWAVGDSGTVLRYAFPSGIRSEQDGSSPSVIFLSPAYPNPFNPSTTLRFGLPRASQVSLVIFDVLGRKTESLYSGVLEAGEHSVMWNCPQCPSGVYVARVTAGNRTVERKMLLVK